MRKELLLITLLLFCSASVIGQVKSAATPVFDVRKVRWGMSKAQVIKSEGSNKPTLQLADQLVYSDIKVAQCNTTLTYSFDDGRLHEVIYTVDTDPASEAAFYINFRDVQNRLEEKYGDKPKGGWIWYSDLYRSDSNKYGYAIKVGDLSILWQWTNNHSKIIHSIFSRVLKTSHQITFTSLPTDDF